MDAKPFYRIKGTKTFKELEGDAAALHTRLVPPSVLFAGERTLYGFYRSYNQSIVPADIFTLRPTAYEPQDFEMGHFTHISLLNDGPSVCTLIFDPHDFGNGDFQLRNELSNLDRCAIIRPGESFDADVYATTLSLSGEIHDSHNYVIETKVRYLFAGYGNNFGEV